MKKFSFNARNIAESCWGRGGTNQVKTNQKGAFYFSCSGHGGYVVKVDALTETERNEIEKYAETSYVNFLTNMDNGEVYGVDYGPIARYCTKRSYRHPMGARVEWRRYEFYMFEEDCEWVVLEKNTTIRCMDRTESREEFIEKYWLRYLEMKKEMAEDAAVEQSGKLYLCSGLGKNIDGKDVVHAIFRNCKGEQVGRIIESSAYDKRNEYGRRPLLEQFEKDGGILAEAGTNYYEAV